MPDWSATAAPYGGECCPLLKLSLTEGRGDRKENFSLMGLGPGRGCGVGGGYCPSGAEGRVLGLREGGGEWRHHQNFTILTCPLRDRRVDVRDVVQVPVGGFR